MNIAQVGSPFSHAPISRRNWLKAFSAAALGTVLSRGASAQEDNGITKVIKEIREIPGSKKYPIILILLQGGLSHIDSFDPKPNSRDEDIRGPFKSIETSVSGIYVTDKLEKMAGRLDKVALYRNVTHNQDQGFHTDAASLILTGSRELISRGSVLTDPPKYDSFPIQLARHMKTPHPGYILLHSSNNDTGFPRPFGALQSHHIETFFSEASDGNNEYSIPSDGYFDPVRYLSRRNLLSSLTRDLQTPATDNYDMRIAKAESILKGNIGKAFDLSSEPSEVREAYGRTTVGNAALTARKLVEAGAPFILINVSGFDHHTNIEKDLGKRLPPVDLGVCTLLEDIRTKNLECYVIVTSEFGRAPKMTEFGGRDHWPRSNFMLVSGPGIKTGVFGGTNERGLIVGNDGEIDASKLGPTIVELSGHEALGIDQKPLPTFTRTLM